MPDDPQRLFGDEEISRILKRASAPETSGLTLDELQQVAAEAGIDPRYVALAAGELERAGEADQRSFHLLGGPVSTLEERVVERELTGAEREEMLAEIRRTFRKAGTVSQVGRTLEWTHSERNDQTQVTITSRGGRTQLRVFQRFPKMTVLTFGGIL